MATQAKPLGGELQKAVKDYVEKLIQERVGPGKGMAVGQGQLMEAVRAAGAAGQPPGRKESAPVKATKPKPSIYDYHWSIWKTGRTPTPGVPDKGFRTRATHPGKQPVTPALQETHPPPPRPVSRPVTPASPLAPTHPEIAPMLVTRPDPRAVSVLREAAPTRLGPTPGVEEGGGQIRPLSAMTTISQGPLPPPSPDIDIGPLGAGPATPPPSFTPAPPPPRGPAAPRHAPAPRPSLDNNTKPPPVCPNYEPAMQAWISDADQYEREVAYNLMVALTSASRSPARRPLSRAQSATGHRAGTPGLLATTPRPRAATPGPWRRDGAAGRPKAAGVQTSLPVSTYYVEQSVERLGSPARGSVKRRPVVNWQPPHQGSFFVNSQLPYQSSFTIHPEWVSEVKAPHRQRPLGQVPTMRPTRRVVTTVAAY